MASKTRLPKPCPFEHPVFEGVRIDPINNHFHGVCRDCGASGPEAESFAEALKAWNARRAGDGKQ